MGSRRQVGQGYPCHLPVGLKQLGKDPTSLSPFPKAPTSRRKGTSPSLRTDSASWNIPLGQRTQGMGPAPGFTKHPVLFQNPAEDQAACLA